MKHTINTTVKAEGSDVKGDKSIDEAEDNTMEQHTLVAGRGQYLISVDRQYAVNVHIFDCSEANFSCRVRFTISYVNR